MTMIKPIIERSVSSFELTPEANREYNNKLQARFTNSAFTLCSSWYRLNKDGKVISIFPGRLSLEASYNYPFSNLSLGSCIQFWWWCRNVNWNHYKTVAADPSQQGVQRKRSIRKGIFVGVSASLTAFLAMVTWQLGK